MNQKDLDKLYDRQIIRAITGTTLKVNEEIDSAVEYFESTYHIVPTHDAETGTTQYYKREAPLFRNVRILKRRHSDYRPGPLKIYTREEIEEYERDKVR